MRKKTVYICKYSLEQWNWDADVTGCTLVTSSDISVPISLSQAVCQTLWFNTQQKSTSSVHSMEHTKGWNAKSIVHITVIAEIFVHVKIPFSCVRELSFAKIFHTARMVSHTLHNFRMLLKFVHSVQIKRNLITYKNFCAFNIQFSLGKINFSVFSFSYQPYTCTTFCFNYTEKKKKRIKRRMVRKKEQQ